jgi:hypothetical protein
LEPESSQCVWRKSSFSTLGDCVAVCRFGDGSIGIRNTNDAEGGPVLVINAAKMADWLARIKAGAFDHLIRSELYS